MPESSITPLTSANFNLVTLDQFLTLVFLLLVLFFMVHSAIVAYHWLTYGSSKPKAFLGTILHIGIGVVILLTMGSIIIFWHVDRTNKIRVWRKADPYRT